MDCSTCAKPVELGQKFISGFEGDQFSINHLNCVKSVDPRKVKTMNAVRMDALKIYEDLKKKASEQVSPAEP